MRFVPDSSCWIIIDELDLLDIVAKLRDRVILIREVIAEVRSDTFQHWMTHCNLPIGEQALRRKVPPELTFGLDLGELAVLEYCLGSGAGWAVVDDLAARIVAERLGVPYIGTARFIKHLGDVGLLAPTFARILIEKLPERGFFIDEEVIEAVLRAPRLSNQNSSDSGGNQTALRPNR